MPGDACVWGEMTLLLPIGSLISVVRGLDRSEPRAGKAGARSGLCSGGLLAVGLVVEAFAVVTLEGSADHGGNAAILAAGDGPGPLGDVDGNLNGASGYSRHNRDNHTYVCRWWMVGRACRGAG